MQGWAKESSCASCMSAGILLFHSPEVLNVTRHEESEEGHEALAEGRQEHAASAQDRGGAVAVQISSWRAPHAQQTQSTLARALWVEKRAGAAP